MKNRDEKRVFVFLKVDFGRRRKRSSRGEVRGIGERGKRRKGGEGGKPLLITLREE